MRVLEVQEQLEGVPHHSSGPPPSQGPPPQSQQGGGHQLSQDAALADGEKALLRQMCNVSFARLILLCFKLHWSRVLSCACTNTHTHSLACGHYDLCNVDILNHVL